MNQQCLLYFLILTSCTCLAKRLNVVHSWKAVDFAFANSSAREEAIKSGAFIFGNGVPIDVDVYYGADNSRTFVTIPRFQPGVPVTLGYVTDDLSAEGNPLIAPYPSWEWNEANNCDSMTSVFRVKVDECERLWVLDTGAIVGEKRVCPPQILSFSLATNKLLSRYRFPASQFTDASIFITPAVDVRKKGKDCSRTFVYIADVDGFALVVYDHANQKSWRIKNKLFYAYPTYGTFNIDHETFDLMDGIFALALGPLRTDGDRTLYFHSLASRTESYVLTSVIRNATLFESDENAVPRSFKPFPMKRPSQSAAEAMDRNGVMFYGLLTDIALACWNSKRFPEFGGPSVQKIVVDRENLQFPSGMKIVTTRKNEQEMWTMTSAFQRFAAGTLSANETNFRILSGSVDRLIAGTKCQA